MFRGCSIPTTAAEEEESMDISSYKLHEGDCVEMMKEIPSASIDCIITDPPYANIDRKYGKWDEANGDPFAVGYSNISRELTEFMEETVPQDPDKRTAKSLRSTGANELEKLLKGEHPRIVDQYLAHGDRKIAKHYRKEDTAALFDALDRLSKVFNLGD
jgi:hypothetical protein